MKKNKGSALSLLNLTYQMAMVIKTMWYWNRHKEQ